MKSKINADKKTNVDPNDASTKEIIYYGLGTLGGEVGNTFNLLMFPILTIVLHINPIIVSMIISIRMIWDAFTDPAMAYISDNHRGRFGRRRPFILIGGLLIPLVVCITWFAMPKGLDVEPNAISGQKIELSGQVIHLPEGTARLGVNLLHKPEVATTVTVSYASGSEDITVDSGSLLVFDPETWATTNQQYAVLNLVETPTPTKDVTVLQCTSPGLLTQEVTAVPEEKKKIGTWRKIKNGFALLITAPPDKKRIIYYLMIMSLLLATVQTVFAVPYYAMGIEIAPSYDGRTKVVAYRSFFSQVIGQLTPWFLPFCLLPFFTDGVQGAGVIALLLSCIAIPSILLCAINGKERTHVDKSAKKISFLKSIKGTISNSEFWKVTALYIIVQKCIGIFSVLSIFIIIYYVFDGDKLKGATYGGAVGMLGWWLATLSIPTIAWMCKKFQKHNTLRFAFFLLVTGSTLNWWCLNPKHPWLMFIVPFFYSFGLSSVYTVLSTMMADVTDVDELRTGSRREGMFGAVMAWIMKSTSSIAVIVSGVILVASGFDVELGVHQEPGVFTKMRFLFSFVPAVLVSLAFVVLYKYPLTRERMVEIKAELQKRIEKRETLEVDSSQD